MFNMWKLSNNTSESSFLSVLYFYLCLKYTFLKVRFVLTPYLWRNKKIRESNIGEPERNTKNIELNSFCKIQVELY